jgi:CheY-like chemotaxis protein/anti-sigma regulatory factor (Ser/Thr protein kinase)
VQSLCESSLAFVKQQAHHKQIKLSCQIADGLIELEADERRLRQVLVNLLNNAVKFTPEKGAVQLQVRADPLRELVEFSITDTGIGIAPENMTRLFQPFVQLDSSLSRRYEGTGLGLALVRRLLDLHGGSVSLASEVGKGSCFTIALPWKTPMDSINPAPRCDLPELPPVDQTALVLTASQSPVPPLILLAEDNEANITTTTLYLQAHGLQIIVARNGLEAIQMAHQYRPALILMDIQMPEIDGLEATCRIRSDTELSQIPIIALTALAMPGDRDRCLSAGANAYMTKPVSLKHMLTVISTYVPALQTSR